VNISLSAASAALLYYLNKVMSRRENGQRNQVFFDSRRFVKNYDRERRPPKLSFPDARWNAYIRKAMNEDWALFLKCANLIEHAKEFADQVKQDETQFEDIVPPSKRDIEIWMRKENLTSLDRKALPGEIRVKFSAGLANKAQ